MYAYIYIYIYIYIHIVVRSSYQASVKLVTIITQIWEFRVWISFGSPTVFHVFPHSFQAHSRGVDLPQISLYFKIHYSLPYSPSTPHNLKA